MGGDPIRPRVAERRGLPSFLLSSFLSSFLSFFSFSSLFPHLKKGPIYGGGAYRCDALPSFLSMRHGHVA